MSRFGVGWVKVYREILSGDMATRDPFILGVFVKLLLMANRYESNVMFGGKQITLKPGQLVTGLRDLSPDKEADPYLHRVRNALRYLDLRASIEQATSNQGRLITICKWDEFQSLDDDASKQRASNAQAERKQSASRAQLNGEYKKEEIREQFDLDSLYRKYPRKIGKKKGIEKAGKDCRLPADFDALSRAIDRYAAYVRANGIEEKYIKHFSTFMNSWTDWADDEAGSVIAGDRPPVEVLPSIDLKERKRRLLEGQK